MLQGLWSSQWRRQYGTLKESASSAFITLTPFTSRMFATQTCAQARVLGMVLIIAAITFMGCRRVAGRQPRAEMFVDSERGWVWEGGGTLEWDPGRGQTQRERERDACREGYFRCWWISAVWERSYQIFFCSFLCENLVISFCFQDCSYSFSQSW